MDPPTRVTHPVTLPRGIVPRVEANDRHAEFVDTVVPPYVLLKITHAEQLANQGETAQSYFGSVPTVITTTTVRDEYLETLTYQDEVDILRQFEPDIHLPADEPTYHSQSPQTRKQRIQTSLSGYITVDRLLDEYAADFDTGRPAILPLIKGCTIEEYQMCFTVFRQLNAPMAVLYGVQYFTTGEPRIDEFVETVETAAAVAPATIDLFIIGGLGPTLTSQYPDCVTATAGFTQWYGRVSSLYTEMNGDIVLPLHRAKAAYDELATATNENLDATVPPSMNADYLDVDPSLHI